MKNIKIRFWEEAPGIQSSTRVFSFLVMLFLFRFDLLYLKHATFVMDYHFLCFNFIFLLAAFTPKYLHKIAELKNSSTLKNDDN